MSDDDPLDPLVAGVRAADRDAIAAVYLEVGPALRGFLLRQVRHGGVADDLVEQVFLDLLRSCTTFRGDGRALRAWLFRAARNDLTDWRRRAARRERPLTPDDAATLVAEDDAADTALGQVADPELVAALSRLTAEQREVVELRFVADLTLAEVADVTGRTVGAVKLLQHRAVRRLAALLENDAGDP